MKQHFKQHEKDVCDMLSLDPTIASGSQWHDVGDGVERNACLLYTSDAADE